MVEVVVRPHPDSSHLHLDHQAQTVTIHHNASKTYSVSVALPPHTTQTELFGGVLQPLLHQWLLEGEHGAMFAYGFTGTGKSYSLFGTQDQPGAIVLAAKYLLEEMSSPGNTNTQLRVSCYEVDGKQCRDLLDSAPLTVRVDENGATHLRHTDGSGPLTRVLLNSTDDFQQVRNKLEESRRVGKSTVHDASSRTHAIVDLEIVDSEVLRLEKNIEEKHAAYIEISNTKDDALKIQIEEAYKRDGPGAVVDGVPLAQLMEDHGRPNEESLQALQEARKTLENYIDESSNKALAGSFSLIDMAGNDWEQATTVQTKQAKKEHSDINSSLLAVKECFRAMQQRKSHVPYRRSHLTKILMRHFGQSSNCVMLTTIYPTEEEVKLKQTMNTLLYASSIAKLH